ncbi:MAG: hypothetical protein WDM71_12110 [Ferruginibacter sp.]
MHLVSLKKFADQHNGWLFGHFGYDLKNETEKLYSVNEDRIGFADMHFFVPEIVLQLNKNEVTIYCDGDAEEIFNAIGSTLIYESENIISVSIQNQPAKSRLS